MKRCLSLLLALAMLLSIACAAIGEEDTQRRVYCKGEIEEFGEDEPLLELYVCPLLGSDAMVMVCEGEIMIVDAGRQNHHIEILEILDRLGTRKVNAVFNTHPHSDHIGSVPNLVKAVEIGVFYTAYPEDFSGKEVQQRTALKAVRAADIPIEHVENGTKLTLGGATIDCVQQLQHTSINDMSCMLHVTYGDCSMLLTGDVDVSAMDYLARTEDPSRLRSDIMKVPHHGLARLQKNFLDAVQPEYAFIPHGIINSTVGQEGLKQLGIPYSFATWGVIHLYTNGKYWIVDHELTEAGQKHQQKYGDNYW